MSGKPTDYMFQKQGMTLPACIAMPKDNDWEIVELAVVFSTSAKAGNRMLRVAVEDEQAVELSYVEAKDTQPEGDDKLYVFKEGPGETNSKGDVIVMPNQGQVISMAEPLITTPVNPMIVIKDTSSVDAAGDVVDILMIAARV